MTVMNYYISFRLTLTAFVFVKLFANSGSFNVTQILFDCIPITGFCGIFRTVPIIVF